jgi:hypothetical protein
VSAAAAAAGDRDSNRDGASGTRGDSDSPADSEALKAASARRPSPRHITVLLLQSFSRVTAVYAISACQCGPGTVTGTEILPGGPSAAAASVGA